MPPPGPGRTPHIREYATTVPSRFEQHCARTLRHGSDELVALAVNPGASLTSSVLPTGGATVSMRAPPTPQRPLPSNVVPGFLDAPIANPNEEQAANEHEQQHQDNDRWHRPTLPLRH